MFAELLRSAGEVVLETLWPTRCAVCDAPGERVLCEGCIGKLPFIDAFKACPRCGAPFGVIQCTECNAISLEAAHLDAVPMDTMAHALIADEDVTMIVKAYKDQDERRLLGFISKRIAAIIPPERRREGCALTFVPDTAKAKRRRGFDHAEEIAMSVASISGMRCVALFETPKSIDQRKLGKSERLDNMRDALKIKEGAIVPTDVIVVDDICTTGATVYGAALALRAAGAQKVHVVTFAKV